MESYKGGSWAKNLGLALAFTGMFTGSLVKGVYGSDKLTKTYDPWEGIPKKNIYLKYEPVYEPPELKKFSLQGKGNPEKEKKPEKKERVKRERLPSRYLKFDLSASPLDNHDAVSDAWYSFNQLVGKGSDYLGIKLGFDRKAHGRVANTLLNLYLSGAAGYYSHEFAHDFINREYGMREGFDVDFSRWWPDWPTGSKIPLYPIYKKHPVPKWWKKFGKEDIFRKFCDGLNQDENKAKVMWERNMLEGNVDFSDSIAYLLGKLSDTFYVFYSGFRDHRDERPEKKGLSPRNLVAHLYENDLLYDDVDFYTLFLYNDGVDLPKEDYFRQSLSSDLASWHTLESFASVWRYLTKGERRSKPTTIKLAKGLDVSPPLFTQYITSNGTFRDAGVFVNPGKKTPFRLSFGKYLNPVNADGKDWRVGAQVYNISLPQGIKASPYLYLDMDGSSFWLEGFSAGSELFFPMGKENGLWTRIGYNREDIVENRVKGKMKGLEVRFGLKIRI